MGIARVSICVDFARSAPIWNALHQKTGMDDLLDALATAVIARRIHVGQATPFPDPPPRDEFNLPMAIWA